MDGLEKLSRPIPQDRDLHQDRKSRDQDQDQLRPEPPPTRPRPQQTGFDRSRNQDRGLETTSEF